MNNTHTIYFGTNRNPNHPAQPTDFGSKFSEDGLANLRFGHAQVDLTNPAVGPITVYDEDPAGGVLGSTTLFDELHKRMRDESADTLVLLHGYNVTFHEALIHAAELEQTYRPSDEALNLVVLSWPSDGHAAHYRNDRHDAKASGFAVARGLSKVHRFLHSLRTNDACQQELHLIAHSMGSYVLRHALYELQKGAPRGLPRLFDQLVLVAADEDNDAFECDYKLARLHEIGRQVTVYFNQNDTPLSMARSIKGFLTRLGLDGPTRPRELPAKITLVDTTVVVEDPWGHSYHKNSPQVVSDVAAVLAGVSADQIPARSYVHQTNTYRLT